MSDSASNRAPLFYRRPEMLTPASHGDLRIRPGGFGFAADANAVPLAVIEFGAAMRHYPVVFAAGDSYPVALLGLDRTNRFVTEGEWAADTYVPAYVRRYPFVFADRADDTFVLAIDRDADHLVVGGTEGEALFTNGEPTDMVRGIMEFCREFHGAHIQTDAFVAGLVEQDLLVPQHADAKLPSGRAMVLSGFKVVDRTKFEALSDEIILDWHRKGWLALIHFHLLSLDRFAALLGREEAANPGASAGTAAPEAATLEALELAI